MDTLKTLYKNYISAISNDEFENTIESENTRFEAEKDLLIELLKDIDKAKEFFRKNNHMLFLDYMIMEEINHKFKNEEFLNICEENIENLYQNKIKGYSCSKQHYDLVKKDIENLRAENKK